MIEGRRRAAAGCGLLAAAWAFLWLGRPGLPAGTIASAGVVAFAGVGVAYHTAAFSRCDPGCPSEGSLSQSLHNTSALFEYVGGLVGLVLLATSFRRDGRWHRAAAVWRGPRSWLG